MHVYPDMCWCFVCGFSCKSSEVISEEEIKKIKPKEKENIEENLQRILRLPVKTVRGLQLHTDSTGYYILFPEENFYLLRRFDDRPRYIGPRGYRVPLFKCEQRGGSKDILIVVEGVINALSLELGLREPRVHIVSPGSANEIPTHVDYYLQYDRIIICVDKDPRGVYNGDRLKKTLLEHGKTADLMALDQDFNDLLQQGGPELVKKVFMKELGL